MSRQRMVKPEFFDSESLAKCSMAARLAFIGLWVEADDFGHLIPLLFDTIRHIRVQPSSEPAGAILTFFLRSL